MPSWAMHLAVTTKVNKKIKKSEQYKNILLLGNLLPDILNGFVIKNISHTISHKETHIQKLVQIENHKEDRYDIEGFYKKYKGEFDNPLMLGYYMHILTDFYWNNLAYGIKGILDDEKYLIGLRLNNGKQLVAPIDELRMIKTNDFRIFSKDIYKNKLVQVPIYDEKMLDYAKDVTWLELKKDDIIETITYVEEQASLKREININNTNYQIFTEKEMLENLDKCAQMLQQKME